ncbi:MAG: DUF5606 domain-containing protein [Paludibacteraceae bacterium]|jgi:hypothetical protein|nr:DUF5606 domain-containing protein [Paludibacteraceae bacterium]
MINGVLSIAGKSGLFRLVSRGRNMLIVESIADKTRTAALANDKVVSLADVAIYTEGEEMPLPTVFQEMAKKSDNKIVSVDLKNSNALFEFFGTVVPTFDRDRVHASDIKKVIQWYNILIEDGVTDFSVDTEGEQGSDAAAVATNEPVKKASAAREQKAAKATRGGAVKRTATPRKAGGS